MTLAMASGVVPELDPLATISAAAAAGFDAVGLWIEPQNWDPALQRNAAAALRDTGLGLIDVEAIWLRPGRLPDTARRAVDIGIRLGAANALVVSSDPDISASADKFAELCDHAAGAPIRINLEFGPFADISTFEQARAILAEVRQPEAALLFDPYHLFRTGGVLADVQSTAKEKLSYAQICDAMVGPDGLGLIDRALPGEGVLPLGDFLSALPPGIPLSVELRSPTLYAAEPDPLRRACRVAQATRAFLARHYSDA
ncbi:sugar phosphate isomerase/epimerase [Sphingomonas vulcanisoli]|uniref:Sugar phosphate isomerase/epimerase n=1 Tax=Sphingomonas vulcanisoli TaxID=1658060 RepID=A0ABX0TTA6_9SPHN|nr:sugar phosphate isomerase/epimerase [Sphingomonas vulcanisoli]NIJ08752.1 sugar phosphate isomerase/epimerase [Sphingomonas vulcanisoli]